MKFNHRVIHDGVLYMAGQEVPIEPKRPVIETPKPEKVEESSPTEVVVEEEPAKVVPKKTAKKK